MKSRIFKYSKLTVSLLLVLALALPLVSCFSISLTDDPLPTAGYSEELTTTPATTTKTATEMTGVEEPGTKPVTETVPPVPLPEPIPEKLTREEIAEIKEKAIDMINNSFGITVNSFFGFLNNDYRVTYPEEGYDIVYHNVKNGNVTDLYSDGTAFYSLNIEGTQCYVYEENSDYTVVGITPDYRERTDLFSYIGIDVDTLLSAPFIRLPNISYESLKVDYDEGGIAIFVFTDDYIADVAYLISNALRSDGDNEEFVFTAGEGRYYPEENTVRIILRGTDAFLEDMTVTVVQEGVVGSNGTFTVELSGTFGTEFGYVPTTVKYICDQIEYEAFNPSFPARAHFVITTSADVSQVFPGAGLNITYDTTSEYMIDLINVDYYAGTRSCYAITTETGTDKNVSFFSAEIKKNADDKVSLEIIEGDDTESSTTAANISFVLADETYIPEEVMEAARAAIVDPTLIYDPYFDHTITDDPDLEGYVIIDDRF